MEEFMMMKIEKLLTISDKMINGKKTEIAKVQDFDKEDIKKVDKTKFKKGKSQRGVQRLESKCFVILKEDFEEYEKDINSQIEKLKNEIAEKDKSIKSLQNRLSTIDEGKEEEIKKLNDDYSERIDKLNDDLHEKDLEIERTKTEYEKKIGGLKIFDADSHMSIADHQKEINNLELFDEEYHMKISDHEKELNKMRGNCLKLRVRENKGYSSYIEELDKLGRWDKFRNKDKAILKEMRTYNNSSIDDKAIDVNFNLIDKER